MTSALEQLLIAAPLLTLLQLLAALPWLTVFDPAFFRRQLRRPAAWGWVLLGVLGTGLAAGLFLNAYSDATVLARWGRFYASLLQLQLSADLFVLVLFGLLWVWPKGAAVALASFREGIRQPMFWMLALAGLGMMAASPFIPYFTFGEDFKMVKELGYANIMMVTVFFAVVAASMSVHEEIEGRTAVTLMSKPLSRRQFLLGKFVGILLAALGMTVLLGWILIWILLYKETYLPDVVAGQNVVPDPAWLGDTLSYLPSGEAASLLRGVGLWFSDSTAVLPGLVIGFCHVMVLLAIAVSLATRLPMIVNIPVCMAVYFLGHLTPILTAVTQGRLAAALPGQSKVVNQLVAFTAQVFDTVLPGLDMFDLSPAIVRDAPLPAPEFTLYTLNVSLYAVMYTAIALLFGLILFEDRDLA